MHPAAYEMHKSLRSNLFCDLEINELDYCNADGQGGGRVQAGEGGSSWSEFAALDVVGRDWQLLDSLGMTNRKLAKPDKD